MHYNLFLKSLCLIQVFWLLYLDLLVVFRDKHIVMIVVHSDETVNQYYIAAVNFVCW